jgi:alkyl hydroperoxide reductase subunit D
MSIETLKARLPEYAKDIRLNLGSLVSEEGLTPQQFWGTWLASAFATRQPQVIADILAEASAYLSPEAIEASKAAAAIMGMNNIYYRFVHLSGQSVYKTLPAKLRMNIIANPGVDKTDFELWSLAVSAINGCGMCIESHEHHLRQNGMSDTSIQLAIRIAATLHAAACVVDAESAFSPSSTAFAAA